LTLVTPLPAQQLQLNLVDGLAFDRYHNLLALLEITGPTGAAVYVDTESGNVVSLRTGMSRADQIALHPSGDLFITSEVTPAATTNRVYRLQVGYDAGNRPVAATTTATALVTSLAINNPEGVVVLADSSAYGNAGDLYVCEDIGFGRVLHVDPATGTTTVLASGLGRPEGMAFGDFGGAAAPALYVAETLNHRVLRVAANGTVSVVGTPASVTLTSPDNVEFGPDGLLYVSEDRAGPSSRIIRIAPDGTHAVFATGFAAAQGLVFHPVDGDLYISEQNLDRIWRMHFASVPVKPTTLSQVKRAFR
jgi:sugar lactone lactonase YvrE